jgi:prevent-host-death family protein
MRSVDIHEAKTHFSKLLSRVMQGERIIIAKNGTPVAELRPFTEQPARRLGELRGQIRLADDFNEPLPFDVLADFER